jgi:hypothetical protein
MGSEDPGLVAENRLMPAFYATNPTTAKPVVLPPFTLFPAAGWFFVAQLAYSTM